MALDAIILDLDGSLVDSNALHAEAWAQVLADQGVAIPAARIGREIGKGADPLLEALLGEEAAKRLAKPLGEAEVKGFVELAESRGLRAFDRAGELLKCLRERGLKLVLATSGKATAVEKIESLTGLKVRDLMDAVVTGDDADESKPSPDALLAACEKLGVHPAQCAMIGDTGWDAEACVRAGVVCIGLRCGGWSDVDLRNFGARMTYADPSDLLSHLDEAITGASRPAVVCTREAMEEWMELALAEAKAGMEDGGAPIGAVILDGCGNVVGRGCNRQHSSGNKTAHAEIVAFASSAGKVDRAARDLILVSTLEPCVMCTGAAMESAVDTIVYGMRAPADGGSSRVTPPHSPESQMPRIAGGILAHRSRELFERFLELATDPQQRAFAEQLLGSI